MSHISRIAMAFAALTSLLIMSCATTDLTSFWKDSTYKGQPHKILVVAITKKTINRRIIEDEFVRQFKTWNSDAVASYSVMPDVKYGDHELIAAKMREMGADVVLFSRLTSKKTLLVKVPGHFEVVPSFYGNWRDYYAYGSQVMFTPGYTSEEELAVMETNLYRAGNDKLIWSATSETELLGTNHNQIKSYISVMVNSMADNKLLR